MLAGLNWQDIPDSELVARIGQAVSSAQREAAFDVIYQRHAPAVLAVCGGRLYDDPDAAQAAAQVALVTAYRDLTEGRPPREPDKLHSWLCGIAANRCHEEIRRRRREDALPDQVADDEYEAASRRRRTEVDRILGVVAATFTESQQRIYQFSTRQGLRGQALASALGVAEKEANDDTWENKKRLWEGFGAYVLALEGRPYCPELAGILDRAAWNGQTFTRVLRLRILRHLGTCPTCGNCGICQEAKKELIRPFAPALLPILAWPLLHGQVRNAIRQVASTQPSRPTQPPLPPPPAAGPPRLPGNRNTGSKTRRLHVPALFGAAAIIPFIVALLITRAVAGSTPGPVIQTALARMPAIAYSTGTGLVVRHGTAPPRTLAPIPVGSTVKRLIWSWNGRWLGWLTGPAQAATADQVHITDTTTEATHTWTCTGCTAGAFRGTQLLVDNGPGPPIAAYPVSGDNPSSIRTFPGSKPALGLTLLGSTPGDAGVIFFSGTYNSGKNLYRTTATGKTELLAHLPDNAAPGADRNFDGAGIVGVSPDGKILAYGGNILGGDTGEPSDNVTVVNLQTGEHATIGLPPDRAQPLRISAVWVSSSDQVYASAWRQPGSTNPTSTDPAGTMPDAAVVPHVYRLQDGHWINTGMITPRGAGGQAGWTALITDEGRFTSYDPRTTGDLVAVSGITRVTLATGVTAFAWAPAAHDGAGKRFIPAASTSPAQVAHQVWIDPGQAPLSDARPAYRPSNVRLSGDSTYDLEHMTWQVWSSSEAIGTGTAGINDCRPNCAGGHWYRVPVRAVFSRPVQDCTAQYGQGTSVLGGTRYWWSQAHLTYPSGLPAALSGPSQPYGLWTFTNVTASARQSCAG